MGRIQGLSETAVLTGNAAIKTGAGFVFSITIAWKGATVGDMVFLRDGTDASGKALVPIIFGSINGTWSREWSQGKPFSTGLFYDEAGVANTFVELTYK